MSEVVFEKGIVTFTFLVTTPVAKLRDEFLAQFPKDRDALSDEQKQELQELDEFLNNPQLVAQAAVQAVVSDLLHDVIKKIQAEKTWPQGSVVSIGSEGIEADAARMPLIRQRIEAGELPGQLVTKVIVITRDKGPFPGFAWLTSQVPEEPGNRIVLLYTEAVRVPA